MMVYGDVALALFLGWMLVANLAGRVSFSQEGKNYWMLKAAPISSRQLLTAKFLVGYLPAVAALRSLFAGPADPSKAQRCFHAIVSLLAVGMILAGLTGIYLAFGVRGAKFDWESPRQMGRAVGCLGTIIGFIYLPSVLRCSSGQTWRQSLLNLPTVIGQVAGLLLGGVAGVAGVLIPLGMVIQRVPRLGEN